MATAHQPQDYENYLEDDDDVEDADSIASIETDDGQEHRPEKIIAELRSNNGFTWYLVKWQDCPVIRSSWEGHSGFESYQNIFNDWEVEKQRQQRGESQPLDIIAFNIAVSEVEAAERQRRTLRRLKKRINRVLSIVAPENSGAEE